MASAINDIGNGLGFLYITKADGVTLLIDGVPNTLDFKTVLQQDATVSAPLSGEITGVGTITCSGNAPTTGLTVNGVSIITGTVPDFGSTLADVAAIRDNINATPSVPKYYATSQANVIYVKAVGQGSAANGFSIAITGITATTTPISGGTDPQDIVDQATGHRYFINANYTASPSPTSLTGAVEITKYLVMRGMQGGQIIEPLTIASNVITPDRKALNMNLVVDTEGGAGTDNLNTILTNGFSFGDIIRISGANPAHVVTVKNFVGGNDNIYLAGGDFVTGAADLSLELQYIDVNGGTWQELSRTPAVSLLVASQRAAGIPIPVSGVNVTALTNGGGTINVTPGVDKGYQIYTGSTLNLAAGQVIQINPAPVTPYLDGDVMWFDYRATNNVASINTVTIGGITLTATQAQLGRTVVRAEYKLSNTTWYYVLFMNSYGLDLVSTAYANANFQPFFGFPASNGQIPVFNTGGFASYVPLPTGGGSGLSQVFSNYYGLTAGTGNGAGTDYAATIPVKTAAGTGRVPFPRNGATNGGSITRIDGSSFMLGAIGTYVVDYFVHTTEPGQLQIELNGVALPDTTSENFNPTAGGHPLVGNGIKVTTTVANSVLAIINPTGNATALTITPANGSDTWANAQRLSIQQVVGLDNSLPAFGINYTEITIPSAQVLTLNSVPFQLIPPPVDSTKAIEVRGISAEIVNGGAITPYSSQTINIITNTATRFQYTISNQFLLSSVLRRVLGVMQTVSSATDTQIISGQGLMATTAADPTTGNSDIKFRILYQII